MQTYKIGMSVKGTSHLPLAAFISLFMLIQSSQAATDDTAPTIKPAIAGSITTPVGSGNDQAVSSRESTTTAGDSESSATSEKLLGVEWVAAQPSSSYTLQLMAASSMATLQRVVKEKQLSGPLAVARSAKGGSGLYLLLQGSYLTLDQAKFEATRIEAETGLKPWLRHFSALVELQEATSTTRPKPSAVKPSVVGGAAWLWSRNPEHYTVQLMGDSRVKGLKGFIERHQPAEPLAIIRVRHKGKNWYLLLSGDYSSVDEASRVVRNLPGAMSSAGPWPRSFASLQEQMSSANHPEAPVHPDSLP